MYLHLVDHTHFYTTQDWSEYAVKPIPAELQDFSPSNPVSGVLSSFG